MWAKSLETIIKNKRTMEEREPKGKNKKKQLIFDTLDKNNLILIELIKIMCGRPSILIQSENSVNFDNSISHMMMIGSDQNQRPSKSIQKFFNPLANTFLIMADEVAMKPQNYTVI